MNSARRAKQQGYVLVMVLAGLALIALVAARLAQRVDSLREQTLAMSDYGRATVEAESAYQLALYWVLTRPLGHAGVGEPALGQALRGDGRAYALPTGAQMRLQDMRGLFALNAADRQSLSLVLGSFGVKTEEQGALIDVLLDYMDTDDLKRLQGAERAEYEALGLAPPRNDYLLLASELSHMPVWRDRPDLVRAMMSISSTNREGVINPNTSPMALLKALQPVARPEQLELFQTLRQQAAGFEHGAAAQAATGLAFSGDNYLFHVSDRWQISVWAKGMPQALQYNVRLVPDGKTAPWQVLEAQPAPFNPEINAHTERVTPFPLVFPPASP